MLASLSSESEPDVASVGGKGASLIRLSQASANVPKGNVLTIEFFRPWLSEIERSDEWRSVLALLDQGQPDPATLGSACSRAKELANALPLTPAQQEAIGKLQTLGEPSAVRSSSPEEDLSGASFAGLYETVLNTAPAGLEPAIRTCFASCLDSRVLLYKLERGFDDFAPRIAVIVQHQVASEVSGVAFSLNPITNDHDEVLVNAAWGLGEALVSGDITPDSVTFNNATNEIVDYHVGNKGGDRADEQCLAGDALRELAVEVKRIEQAYGFPVDVEWAFAEGRLYILQSRPITAHLETPTALLTQPDEPRHLYIDGYLNDGITMNSPISPVGNDLMRNIFDLMIKWALVPQGPIPLAKYGLHFEGGRFFLDMSLYLHLLGSGEALAKQAESMEPTVAAIMTSGELDRYRLPKPPKHVRRRAIVLPMLRLTWRVRRALFVVARALLERETFRAEYEHILEEFDRHVRRPLDFDTPIGTQLYEESMHFGTMTMNSSYPGFMTFYVATFGLKSLIDDGDPRQVELLDALLSGYEDDLVVQMGHALFDLAQLLPAGAGDDLAQAEQALAARELPSDFLQKWDAFQHDYGHRGPLEMDPIHPRYGDSPRLALQQIAAIARSGGSFNPHEVLARKVKEREAAFAELQELLPPRKSKKLAKLYADLVAYNGARELFKHHLTQIYHRVRKLLLHRAEQFLAANRIDHVDDIFQISIADVDDASADPGIDVRALVRKQGADYREQCASNARFPFARDSRGRVFQPEVYDADLPEGTIAGAAVSGGVASGPVKVLNDPFEKELEPGDILVAVTTDPGWTPLFINAAAVLLEIGGELQHGALVAREYGKPCVTGIGDITNRFADGQRVEVDGDAGLVRLLD